MEKKKEPLRCRSVAEDDSMSWREVAGLNEIIDVGCYVVQLKHGAGNDELPLPPCDQEHYIVATLIVTESGTEKLQKNRVIGQTLILSQCNDGQTGIYYRSLSPVDGEPVWSEWNALLSTGQFNKIADGSTNITLEVKDSSVTAQKLSADVRKKVDSPLRPLYIAAGAEYNDSGSDKSKTTTWGETVTHKAGHYYLNGLGDITEEQMMNIYNAPHIISTLAYAGNFSRTFLINNGAASAAYPSLDGVFTGAIFLEILGSGSEYLYTSGACDYMFYQCANLKHIMVKQIILTYAKSIRNMFGGCLSLITVKIDGLKLDLSLKDSSVISKESVLYIVQKASPTSAITITLHSSAYARLKDDADIVMALEAQPLISLVSA